MNFTHRYLGRSTVDASDGASALRLQPNLARPEVAFDGEIANPVRFREAVSALHDVVVSNLVPEKKDRSAWLAWKEEQVREEERARVAGEARGKAAALADSGGPPPPNLDADYRRWHKRYWEARDALGRELQASDPQLWRHLVPLDPLVTVAADVVLFEAFSKDLSSYGCLTVDRGAFRDVRAAREGTTNVDYSTALYEHFQTLRSYRAARLAIDPAGFGVAVEGRGDLREEKIELPPAWLRGFGQLQAAMLLPVRTVELKPGDVAAILGWLVRHREKASPRSLRFSLRPGQAPRVTLEPWGTVVTGHGRVYDGEREEEIKVWGRRRLTALARLLPLAERIEVQLLGSGLPSVWVVSMGELRFTLALSGWSANDWSGGAQLDLLAGATAVSEVAVQRLGTHLSKVGAASFAALAQATGVRKAELSTSLAELARLGQVVYDFGVDKVRFRSALPVPLGADVIGPEPPELAAGRALVREVRITRDEVIGTGLHATRLLREGTVGGTKVEVLLNLDLGLTRAQCSCSHFHRFRLRKGPCRHLAAVVLAARSQIQ